MNAKQRRHRDHQRRMSERRAAKRFLRLNRGQPTGLLGLFAHLTLQPDAYKPNPALNWWGAQHFERPTTGQATSPGAKGLPRKTPKTYPL